MNRTLIALASAFAATAALASAAQAGGGVRLGFGGPLGTFVATPAHGGGGAYSKPARRHKAPVQQATRKPAKAAPRIAKVEPPAPPKAARQATQTEPAAEEAPRATGSSALIQGSIPPQEPDAAAASSSETPEVKAEAPSEPGLTATTDDADTCRRFIPSVGMTVSVGCDE